MGRVNRRREERIANGNRLMSGDPNKPLTRNEFGDILLALGSSRAAVTYNLAKHFHGGKVPTVATAMQIKRKRKEYIRKDAISVNHSPTIANQKWDGNQASYHVTLSDSSKKFLVKLSHKKNLTVPCLIAKMIDEKINEYYAKIEDMLLDEINVGD